MNKRPLKGFDEIKANARLVAKTKNRMLNLPKSSTKHLLPKSAVAAALVLTLSAALIFGIANGGGGKYLLTAKATNLMQGVTPHKMAVNGALTDSFVDSTADFSVGLFKKLYKDVQNTLVSPASACLALGMTANGASGDTRTAFTTVLGKYGMDVDSLDKAYKAYGDLLTEKKGSTTLALTNAIWYDQKFSAKKDFLQNNADYFSAAAQKLDFGNQGAADVINRWVKKNTGGKIDRMIDKIDPDTVMFLMNAVYFNGKWEHPFEANGEKVRNAFYPESGGKTTANYMALESSLKYAQTDSATSVLLPYDDGRFAMLLILPQKGEKLADYIGGMTQKTIADIAGKMQKTDVTLELPQFKTESSNSLREALSEMGLGVAFDPNNADFSKMGSDKDGLHVASVSQKAFLQIDEKGTEAAADTNVEMQLKSMPVDVSKHVIFNRPFVYAVIDTKTDLPLFLGANCTVGDK